MTQIELNEFKDLFVLNYALFLAFEQSFNDNVHEIFLLISKILQNGTAH